MIIYSNNKINSNILVGDEIQRINQQKIRKKDLLRYLPVYLLILPSLVYIFINNYIPMAGIIVAFKKYSAKKGIFGSDWIGLKNFTDFFNSYYFGRVLGNTLHGQIIRGLADEDPDKLYFRAVFLDAAQLARILMAMPEVDETRVGAYGGSQGGGLTLACAALTPGMNRAAPHMPFLCDYRRVWEMDLDVDAYAELREYFRHSDPLHLREREVFTRLGYIDNQHLAGRIRARVRMYTGLLDTICPPSSQFAAYNKITAPKEMRLYPDFAHEWYPGLDDDTMQFMLGMR